MTAVNPALVDLEPLVGRWRMELHGASFLPDPDVRVALDAEIAWIEHGAALAIRQGDWASPPAAVWIVGRDEGEPGYSVLYADDRGVPRRYRMTFGGTQWSMWRETVEFSQRFHATLDEAGGIVRGRWEKSTDGGATWDHDFNVDYVREGSSQEDA